MAHVLIVYVSHDGQTARIARCIGEVLREQGQCVTLWDARHRQEPDPLAAAGGAVDGVIVGGAIRKGRYARELRAWVRRHRARLAQCPSAFFSVSLAAASPEEAGRADALRCLENFLSGTGWQPALSASFAGALPYTRYGWLLRRIMRGIVRRAGSQDLDMHRDYEYTDWEAVRAFASDFLAELGASAA